MQDDEQYVENNENNLQQPIHIECEKPIYKINFCCFMFYNLFEWEEWNKKKKVTYYSVRFEANIFID